MVRKNPRWAPRKSTVMASRTRSVASAPTSSVTAKRSIAKERCCAPAGPASPASSAATRRASLGRPRLMCLSSERNLGYLPLIRAVQLEVGVRPKLEEARDEIRWKGLDRRVEIANDGVEVPARVLDGVLDLAERGLERLEVGARLEIGIRLGQREETAQGLAELALGLGARLGRLRDHRGAAGLHHRIERPPLVRRVALDRLDEVRHEIGAALELDVHVRPRRLRALRQGHQAVVADDDEDDDDPDRGQEDHEGDAHSLLLDPS